MTNMITRCPSCETSFRITEAQLKSAKGSVRCGSCLQIFKAVDNLVLRKQPAANAAPPPNNTTLQQAAEPPQTPVASAPEPSLQPKPEALKQEIPEPEFVEPEFVEPEFVEPEFVEPELSEPEAVELEASNPETEMSPIFEFDDEETVSPEADFSSAAPVEKAQTAFEIFAEAVEQSEPRKDDLVNQALPEAHVEEIEEPFIEETLAEETFLEETVLEEPTFTEPAFKETSLNKPIIEESIFEEPTFEESALEEISLDKPIIKEPIVAEPYTDEPVNDAIDLVDSTPAAAAAAEDEAVDEEEIEFDLPDTKSTFSFDQAAIDNDDTSKSQSATDDDDLLISDEMDFEDDEPKKETGAYGEDLVESFLDLDTWQPTSSSLFDHGNADKKEKDDEDGEKDPDESWAIDLLEEDDDEDAYPASAKSIDLENPETEEDAIDSLGMIGVVDDLKRSTDDYSRANTGSFAAIEDEDLEEYDHEDHLGEPLAEKVEPKLDEEDSAGFVAPYSEPDDEGFDEYEEEYDDYSDDPKNRGALLRRIQPEPVEFAFYQGGNSWGKRALWSGIVCLGVLVLILQIAWLQFDTLSRQEPYRAWYSTFCPTFGCAVPDLSAPQLIRTSNLVVRSHPNVANALMIDTILRNTAPYQQPFPDLVLTFSNLQGKILASRRFTPAEYLGGEMAGKTDEMPSKQPIHLSLEITDPGPEAVNYSVFIPN